MEIIIKGEANSGKSTIAEAIGIYLHNKGFKNVIIEDRDTSSVKRLVALDSRVKGIAEFNKGITIITEQTPRKQN